MMVISYKNRFIKAFIAFLLISLGSILFLIGGIRLTHYVPSLNFADRYIIDITSLVILLTSILVIISQGLYFYCHYLLAKAKGYSGWLTLLGFISAIGLAIIFLLPDKRKMG